MHTCTQCMDHMHVTANYYLIHWCIVEHSIYLQGEKPESIHYEAMHNKKRRKVSNRESTTGYEYPQSLPLH